MRVRISLALLLIVTAGVYAGVAQNDYIVVDDPAYVIMNPWVMGGLSGSGLVWAFTSFHAFNWHPLTWISHMADIHFLGSDPTGVHLVNLALHLLATLFAFLALRRLTGRDEESLAVAALFALHPMHVESVAWIAERKDVLSACFWFLCLWSYASYAVRKSARRYAMTLFFFSCGLLAKPMVVTLPFVLLLLDVWPLKRANWSSRRSWGRLVLEKVPFLVLALGASLLTLAAQQPGVANTVETLPLAARLSNAAVSYARYLLWTPWPPELAPLYPHSGWVPLWQAFTAALLLSVISGLAWLQRESRPYLLVGWLWFLGTLVPVIGLVQVGSQSMADRYTYLPHLGLFVMATWTIGDLVRNKRVPFAPVLAGTLVLLTLFAFRTRAQVALWYDTQTLFAHTIAVTPENPEARFSLATVLLMDEKYEEARTHLAAAIEAQPLHSESLNALGNLARRDNAPEQALNFYVRAATAAPWHFESHLNAATLLDERGEIAAAIPYYRRSVRLEPFHTGARLRLARALESRGFKRRATAQYQRILHDDPSHSEARTGLRRLRRAEPEPAPPDQPSGSM